MIDRHDLVRTGRGEADLEHIMRADAGVQRHSPPSKPMGVDQRGDLAGELRLSQGFDHEISFPGLVGLGVPVLDRAAPADAEMRAKRRDALRACALDGEQAATVGMGRHGCYLDGFARERVGNVDVLSAGLRNAIAEMTDVIDNQAFNHGARR